MRVLIILLLCVDDDKKGRERKWKESIFFRENLGNKGKVELLLRMVVFWKVEVFMGWQLIRRKMGTWEEKLVIRESWQELDKILIFFLDGILWKKTLLIYCLSSPNYMKLSSIL